MHIFVRACDAKTTCVEVPDHVQTTDQLRDVIESKIGSLDCRHLLFGLRYIDECDCSLEDCSLLNGSTIDIVPVMAGGKGKKKKKAYSTPKKNKHVKKKVKLAILKYYKVNDNGEVVRCRRECSNSQCGAGVFMATHFDRYYCGRCALTFMIETGPGSKSSK